MFWWQKADFEHIDGEPTWEHLEDIRLRLWLLEYVSYGLPKMPVEGDGLTAATWEAYAEGLPSGQFPMYAGQAAITFVKFEGEYYNCTVTDSGGISKTVLKNNPPAVSGVLNESFWAYAARPWRYQDWNLNSRRTIAQFASTTVSGTDYVSSICEPAHRWKHRQTDPSRQRDFIRYQDTEREIPHLLPVEYARRYITQRETLGPNFDVTYEDFGGGTKRVTKMVGKGGVAKEVGWAGGQYTLQPAQPEVPDDLYQWFHCPKNDEALQNQIERIGSAGNWSWPVDLESEQGQSYERNFENYLKWMYSLPLSYEIDEWSSDGIYSKGDILKDKVAGMERYAYYVFDGTNEWGADLTNTATRPLIHGGLGSARPWTYIGMVPHYAYMYDALWGCNESSFELMLWLHGDYDWAFVTEFPYVPSYILEAEDIIETLSDYRPAGTWRRTWKRSMGGPKNTHDDGLLWPQEKEDLPGGDYFVEVEDEDRQWPYFGFYNFEIPDIVLTEEEQGLIDDRHGPVHTSAAWVDDQWQVRKSYELHGELIKQAWDILDSLKYLGISTQWEFIRRNGGAANIISSTANGAYQEAKTEALSSLSADGGTLNNTTTTLGLYATVRKSGSNWSCDIGLSRSYIGVKTGLPDWMRGFVSDLSFLVKVVGRSNSGGVCVFENGEYQLPDGSTGSAPNTEEFQSNNHWLAFHFISVPLDEFEEWPVDTDIFWSEIKKLNEDAPDEISGSSDFYQVWSQVQFDTAVIGRNAGDTLAVIDLDTVPEEIINEADYKVFTEVATDTGKFDDAGQARLRARPVTILPPV